MPDGDNAWRNHSSCARIHRLMRRGGTGAHEAAAVGNGAKDGAAVEAIASRIRASGQVSRAEASGIALRLVSRANEAMAELDNGAPASQLSDEQALGLEAVLHVSGRPAIRVLGNVLESLALYPGGDIWSVVVDVHRRTILSVCGSTAAVHVRDVLVPDSPWVQGTAWLFTPELAMTNRHVLVPPMGGVVLARRAPGSTAATLKRDYTVTLDFAFDNGAARSSRYKVVDIPFVAADGDPVDAAVLRVEPIDGARISPLPISSQSVHNVDRLFVVGHPGRMASVPREVNAVFGSPDERKRVSFGMAFDADSVDPPELVHDASSIGGYSGGPVLEFMNKEVRALHYWGDPKEGNRAISCMALRRHATLSQILPRGA